MTRIVQSILIASYLLCFSLLQSYGQIFTITEVTKLKGNVKPQGISADRHGNIYVMGEFKSEVQFASFQLTGKDSNNIFLAKFDTTGRCFWVHNAYGSNVKCKGIVTDENGNCFLAGIFQGIAVFGSFTLRSLGETDIFVAKYDGNGNCTWAKQIGSTGNEEMLGISLSSNYGIYITGYFNNTLSFGSYQLKSSGSSDIFLARYDIDGNCIWVKRAGGINDDIGTKLSSDSKGYCVIIGYCGQNAVFDSTELMGQGGVYIARYDANGKNVWAKSILKTDYYSAGITGIAADENGNTIITRNYEHNFQMVKYDAKGNPVWEKAIDEAHQSSHLTNCGIFTDKKGNIFIAGSYYKIDFLDSVYLGFDYDHHNYLARCDSNGVFTWVKKIEPGYTLTALTNDLSGYSYLAGYFDGGAIISRTASPTLEIVSPRGNEIWQINSNHNITWKTNDDGPIKIEISTDNGADWITLSNSVSASLNNYVITVPPLSESNKCKIKITSLSYYLSSESLSNFSVTTKEVPDIRIISPNVSERWFSGSGQIIKWEVNGSIASIKLEYSIDAGTNWISINNSISANQMEYLWNIPNTPSDKCWVRASDIANPNIYDVSDNYFSISSFDYYKIEVSSPKGGEIFKAGTKKEIKWQGTLPNIYVNIFYSTSINREWNLIATLPSQTGTYIWTIPEITSSDCKIKISDSQNPDLYAESDSAFTIWTPFYYTVSPPDGQFSQAFGNTNITLDFYVIIPAQITVIYNWKEIPTPGLQPEGILSVSPYYWDVNSSGISFFNGIISVLISMLPDVTDKTKLVWIKRDNKGSAWKNLEGAVLGDNLVSVVKFTSFGEFAIGITDNSNSAPLLVYPSDKALNLPSDIKLTWSDLLGAQSYRVQISTDSLFMKLTIDDSVVTSTSKHVSGLGTATKYYWRVNAKREKGVSHYSNVWSFSTGIPSPVEFNKNSIPEEYELSQNYPNPFNPTTRIKYSLPKDSYVRLKIYNSLGEFVRELVNEIQPAGYKEVIFHGNELSSGVYFCSMEANSVDGSKEMKTIKKVILLK